MSGLGHTPLICHGGKPRLMRLRLSAFDSSVTTAVRKMVPAEQDEGVDVAVERVAVDARDADWAVDASTEAVAPAVEAAVVVAHRVGTSNLHSRNRSLSSPRMNSPS